MKPKVWFVVGAVGIVALLLYGFGIFDRSSDSDKIRVALTRAIKASKEGRAGGVLDYMSRDFEINGMQYGGSQIASLIRSQKPDVEVLDVAPNVQGDSAQIVSPVNLSINMPEMQVRLDKVTMWFSKENDPRLGIFPAKNWKLTKVEIPQEVYQQLADQYGGVPGF